MNEGRTSLSSSRHSHAQAGTCATTLSQGPKWGAMGTTLSVLVCSWTSRVLHCLFKRVLSCLDLQDDASVCLSIEYAEGIARSQWVGGWLTLASW